MEAQKEGQRILVGRFGAAHGVRGELRLQSFTQDPAAIARYGALSDASGTRRFEIKALRPVKDNILVAKIAGVSDRSAAEALTNTELYVPRDALPAPDEDEFYLADLIGLVARDAEGAVIGTIVSVPNYGAGDILEITPAAGGESLLLPFTKAVVPVIDLAAGQVTVVMPEVTEDEPGGSGSV